MNDLNKVQSVYSQVYNKQTQRKNSDVQFSNSSLVEQHNHGTLFKYYFMIDVYIYKYSF